MKSNEKTAVDVRSAAVFVVYLHAHTERVGQTEGGGDITVDSEASCGVGGNGRKLVFHEFLHVSGINHKSAGAVFVVIGLHIKTAVAYLDIKSARTLARDVEFVGIESCAECVIILGFKKILHLLVYFFKFHIHTFLS